VYSLTVPLRSRPIAPASAALRAPRKGVRNGPRLLSGSSPLRNRRSRRFRRSIARPRGRRPCALPGRQGGVLRARNARGRAGPRLQRGVLRGLPPRSGQRGRREQPAPGDAVRPQEARRKVRSLGGPRGLAAAGPCDRQVQRRRVRAREDPQGSRDCPAPHHAALRPRPGRRHAGHHFPLAGQPPGDPPPLHRRHAQLRHRPSHQPARARQVWLEGPGPEPLHLLGRRLPQRDGHHEPHLSQGELPAGKLRAPGRQPATRPQRRRRRRRALQRLHDAARSSSPWPPQPLHRIRQQRGRRHRLPRLPYPDAAHRGQRRGRAEPGRLPPLFGLPAPRHGFAGRRDHPERRHRQADADPAALGLADPDAAVARRPRHQHRPGDPRPRRSGEVSRSRFEKLGALDRYALLAFLNSL
jgi:hypothetical protein